MEGLAGRLRAAAGALADVEAGWLRGAASLVDRGAPARAAARAEAVWLAELATEARARKASLLAAWVDAAGALRAALHLHEREHGPLAEALFPEWRAPALRRHQDQALAAETELRRRLASGYVARRLAEPGTQSALRPTLDALERAGAAWGAERDRPPLSGAEAETVRARLLAVAEATRRSIDRVRWVVRAALVDRPELVEAVFPRRGRATEALPQPSEGAGPASSSGAEPLAALTEADRSSAATPHAKPAPTGRATRSSRPRAHRGRGKRSRRS